MTSGGHAAELIGDAESRNGSLAAKDKNLVALTQKVDGLTKRFETLFFAQSDELTKKQLSARDPCTSSWGWSTARHENVVQMDSLRQSRQDLERQLLFRQLVRCAKSVSKRLVRPSTFLRQRDKFLSFAASASIRDSASPTELCSVPSRSFETPRTPFFEGQGIELCANRFEENRRLFLQLGGLASHFRVELGGSSMRSSVSSDSFSIRVIVSSALADCSIPR